MQCGRGDACFAAKCTEVESESGTEDVYEALREAGGGEGGGGGGQGGEGLGPGPGKGPGKGDELVGDGGGGGPEKAGYWRQEIEGIGGVVKRKVKRRVRVGRAVREYEDERECAGYLEREGRGEERSWCGWCWRVVPGLRDLDRERDAGGWECRR